MNARQPTRSECSLQSLVFYDILTTFRLHYLMKVCGFDEAASKRLIKEKSSRKLNRSPSRTREEL